MSGLSHMTSINTIIYVTFISFYKIKSYVWHMFYNNLKYHKITQYKKLSLE